MGYYVHLLVYLVHVLRIVVVESIIIKKKPIDGKSACNDNMSMVMVSVTEAVSMVANEPSFA